MGTKKTVIVTASITLLFASLCFAFFNNFSIIKKDNFSGSDYNDLDTKNLETIAYRQQLLNQINQQRKNIITETVQMVSPAVVGINVTEVREYRPYANDPFYRLFFGDQTFKQEVKELGSGFIISPDGYIVTNDHVAGNGSKITVTMSNGKKFEADIIGTDKTTDICLLKIKADNLPYIKFAESDELLIGEWSIAIGNPFGLFEINDKPSVTVGVISSVGMNLGQNEDRYYLDMIQTDAAINRGNSGGPLVNAVGELIGMNTIIYSPNVGSGSVGVGFAIPASKIRRITSEIKSNGTIERDFNTGIYFQNIDDRIAKYYKLNNTIGVLITDIIKNSPADKAGLKSGDIIYKLGKYVINNIGILGGAINEYRPGDEIELQILRNSQYFTKKLKLEKK